MRSSFKISATIVLGAVLANAAQSEPWQAPANWHRLLKKDVRGSLVLEDAGVEFRSPKFNQRWAYVDTGGLSTSAPRVVEGEDYIFVESGRAVVASMMTAPEDVSDVAPLFERFVHSLSY